ncbi:hypothetical protein EJ04DRAFT_524943 [Polyplosphaeria fusca]|uniref:Uncharacterized protein n=1 Tax=Polyplosphaeria fusca TaxID=682080 RepID=A0A9P4QXM3_9PLEO|nr:hypothetical protein EJ04DRAFT_524943 [Polyplosphaeria fusca]
MHPEDELTSSICTTITISTHLQQRNENPLASVAYTIPTASTSIALTLLRNAVGTGVAHLLRSTDVQETYALRTLRDGPEILARDLSRNEFDAQWWVGKSKAEIKARPGANEHSVRTVSRVLDRNGRGEASKRRERRSKIEDHNLGLELRRQEAAERGQKEEAELQQEEEEGGEEEKLEDEESDEEEEQEEEVDEDTIIVKMPKGWRGRQ